MCERHSSHLFQHLFALQEDGSRVALLLGGAVAVAFRWGHDGQQSWGGLLWPPRPQIVWQLHRWPVSSGTKTHARARRHFPGRHTQLPSLSSSPRLRQSPKSWISFCWTLVPSLRPCASCLFVARAAMPPHSTTHLLGRACVCEAQSPRRHGRGREWASECLRYHTALSTADSEGESNLIEESVEECQTSKR